MMSLGISLGAVHGYIRDISSEFCCAVVLALRREAVGEVSIYVPKMLRLWKWRELAVNAAWISLLKEVPKS